MHPHAQKQTRLLKKPANMCVWGEVLIYKDIRRRSNLEEIVLEILATKEGIMLLTLLKKWGGQLLD